MSTIAIVTPPSPPHVDIDRQAAGGMGLCKPTDREDVGHSDYPQYDLPLLSTAGLLLQHGHQVEFIDGQAERLDAGAMVRRVAKIRPDYIVGMAQFVSLTFDVSLLSAVKRGCEDATLVVVGSTTKVALDRVFEDPDVDYAVLGEPEVPSDALVSALEAGLSIEAIPGLAWREGADLRQNNEKPVDLNSLPPMPYHLLAPYRYVAETYWKGEPLGLAVSARGCPYSCDYYCPYPLAYGKKIRSRNPETFVEEVAYLNREMGVKYFHFRDQVFTVSERHVREVCQALIRENLDIEWLCETRFNLLHSDEMLKEMHEAGCTQVHFGLETGSDELFRTVGKPGTTLEVALEAFERVRDTGMDVHVHLIVGLPGENWDTVRDTAAFLRRADLQHVNLNRAIPYPGTEMWAEAQREGWVESEDFAVYGAEFVMRTAAMSTVELELAYLHLIMELKDPAEMGRRGFLRRYLLRKLVGQRVAPRVFGFVDRFLRPARPLVERTFGLVLAI